MRYYIKTFGCQMNEYDSARVAERLAAAGFEPAGDPREADVVVVNTCSVRHKADQKMASLLGRLSRILRPRPQAKLVVMGCVAQLRGRAIQDRFPRVDLVLGTDQLPRFQEWLESGMPRSALVERRIEGFEFIRACPRPGAVPVSVPVTVMKGCDNRCAYCVVPSARGPQVNRPWREILEEVDLLVEAGAREIQLVGQNVNAYRSPEGGFGALLRAVADRPGVLRVRFTTSHPRDLDEDTVRAVAEHPRIQPHFHLPVQSGSTRILRAMGRGYTRERYLEKVALIREFVPEAAVSADVIVGYPGETRRDFEETLSLVERVRFSFIYSFKYSPRPGTRAAARPDDVPATEKARRLAELQELQQAITEERLHGFVGREVEVLAEGRSKRGDQLTGRAPTYEVVNFVAHRAEGLVGSLVRVRILAAGAHSLEGELVAGEGRGSAPQREVA